MPVIDLHTHSKYSDGTLPPAEVVRRAHAAGVGLLVLSDHDTTAGWGEAKAEAEALGLRLRPGVEINTVSDQVHLLGYGIDPDSPALASRLEEFRARRRRRIAAIVERLQKSGLEIDFQEVEGVSGETLGRPHVADALLRKNIVGSRREAFDRFLVRGKPGYVQPLGPTVPEAIEAIRSAGGFAVLAHPGLLRDDRLALAEWKEMGLEGIEAYYLSHSPGLVQEFLEVAKEHDLLPTGGSDFHGPKTGRERIGGVEVPQGLFERLLARV